MHLKQLFLLLLMLKLMLLLLLGGGEQRVHELLEVAVARVDNAVAGEQLLLRQLVRVRRERRRVALAPAAAGHRFGANCAPRNAGQTYILIIKHLYVLYANVQYTTTSTPRM